MSSQTKVVLSALVALSAVTSLSVGNVNVEAAEGDALQTVESQVVEEEVVSEEVAVEDISEEVVPEEVVVHEEETVAPEVETAPAQAEVAPLQAVLSTTDATIESGSYYDDGVIGSRIQNGDRYRAEATITNNSDTEATVRFAVAHVGDPTHLIWEATASVAPNSTQTVEGISVPNDSSNDTHLMVFNDSDSDVIVDPSSVTIAPLPYTEEEIAEQEAEVYATLPEPSLDFRVNPYLQSPASDSMTLNWVSEFAEAGTVTLTEAGTNNTVTQTADSTYMELSEYTIAEIQQALSFNNGNGESQTIEQGSWLLSNSNYKNVVDFTNLKPNTTYNYTVTQGDSVFEGTFKTFPTAEEWDELRLIAFSDTETEPLGRLENREWELHVEEPYADGSEERPEIDSLYAALYGYARRNGFDQVRYPLTQTEALNENLKWIDEANPDALIIAGDLTQGAGYQPAWDEFWRHFAGEYGSFASETALLTAIGNWETYAALNGGYGEPALSRNKYHDYMDTPGDANNAQYKDSYYRTDIGPVTLITLDSTKGVPTEVANAYTTGEIYGGDDSILNPELWATEGLDGDPYLTTDTQGSFTLDEYNQNFVETYPGLTAEDTDMATFNPGSEQWAWAVEQLADARANGQIILVQFHHAPYSSGVHGTPPNHEHPDNQSGVAMRVYQSLFKQYGVAAVIAGHDEMFERSFVDTDNDGLGLHVYDVGVAADGLRSEKFIVDENGNRVDLNYNSYSAWSATQNEPELWDTNENGVKHLIDGGLHYGHLQIDLLNTEYGAEMTLTPVYIFPILDDNYEFVETERRVYDDVVVLYFNENGEQITAEEAQEILARQALEERLAALENRVNELEAENAELNNQVDALRNDLTDAQERIADLENRVADLETQVAALENETPAEETPVEEDNESSETPEEESIVPEDDQNAETPADDKEDAADDTSSEEELPETGSAAGTGLVAAVMSIFAGLGLAFNPRKKD